MFPSPSLEPPELEDFQWSYNGLTMGAGTAYGVLKVEGLDLAGIRSGDVNWPRDHGQAAGLDLYEGRDVVMDLWLKTDGTSLQHAQLALAAATNVRPNEEIPLWFQLPNLPLLCVMCRPRKRKGTIDANYAAANIYEPELQLHATDPRIYEAGETTTIARGETKAVENKGNTEMRPIITLNGPSARPKITNTSLVGAPYLELINPKATREEAAERVKWVEEKRTKEEIETKEAAQKVAREAREKQEREGIVLTIAAGDQLVIDLGTPHLLTYYKGGVESGEPENVSAWLAPGSTWWDLPPASYNIEYSSYDEEVVTGNAVVDWASAYEL